MRRLGITDQGAMAEYAVVPAKDLVKLPKDASLKMAALSEPLSVGLHATGKVKINRDDHFLIFGAGTIGLIILTLLKHFGARSVTVIEPDHARRTIAEAIGATKTIDPYINSLDSEIDKLTDNKGMNVIFECAGLPETIQEACSQGAVGATVVVLSICYLPVELNFLSLVTKEIKIITAFGKTDEEFKKAANMIALSLVDLSPLVTGLISPDRIAETFDDHSGGKIKTLVEF